MKPGYYFAIKDGQEMYVQLEVESEVGIIIWIPGDEKFYPMEAFETLEPVITQTQTKLLLLLKEYNRELAKTDKLFNERLNDGLKKAKIHMRQAKKDGQYEYWDLRAKMFEMVLRG